MERFVDRGRRAARGPVSASASGRRSRPGHDGFFAQLLELRQAILPVPTHDPKRSFVEQLVDAPHERFQVDARGQIRYGTRIVGTMTSGVDRLHPEVALTGTDDAGAGARSRVQRRLVAWTRDLVGLMLAPLRHLDKSALSPAGRGLLYQLEQNLGTVWVGHAREQLASLSQADRLLLEKLGIRLGRRLIYVPSLLFPQALLQRAALCEAFRPAGSTFEAPDPRAPSVPAHAAIERELYTLLGYPVFGPRAIRADVAEQVLRLLRRAARRGPFSAPPEMAVVLECPSEDVGRVIQAFGYRPATGGRFQHRRRAARDRAARP